MATKVASPAHGLSDVSNALQSVIGALSQLTNLLTKSTSRLLESLTKYPLPLPPPNIRLHA